MATHTGRFRMYASSSPEHVYCADNVRSRPPDPTFCMYLSPVDTLTTVRPCKVRPHHRPTMVASVCMRRRQVETWSDPGRPTRTRLSACIMVRMATHTDYVCVVDKSKHGPIPAGRPTRLSACICRPS